MAAIPAIMTELIGSPTTPLESAVLFALSGILSLVVYDTVLDVFRIGARILRLT